MSTVAVSPVSAFKGLAAFEDSELDALFFFGRERETEVILANLLASKLTVLYGPSGVGKSSILRAAVARRLRDLAPGAEVTLIDAWSGEPSLPTPGGEAFLILDQLEEYFLYHDETPLLGQLAALLELPRVHVLLALREDALARLDAFQARIPTVLENRVRLEHLDVPAARAAIVGPLDSWNAVAPPDDRMGIETALVDAVVAQVASAPGRIEAPYLQLVLERVWEEERAGGSAVLRADTLQRLGGAETIVSAHLERALGALPPHDAEIATSALKFLVTPSRTKIAHSLGDLVGYTNESPLELRAVLEALAAQRIVRAVADGGDAGRRYEIFHDVLAEPVLAWRREFEGRAALAATHRRQRRLMALAGGAVLVAAAMVALAAYAFTQRGEASKQRRAALHQADVALGQKNLAQRRKKAALAAEQAAKRAKHKATASAQNAKLAEAKAKHSAAVAQASEARAKRSATQAAASEQKAVQSAARQKKSAAFAKHEQFVALQQARHARKQARLAKVGDLVATAAANLDVDPVRSVEAAVAASALEVSNPVEDALRNALVALRVRGILDGGGGAVNAAVFSPDGSLVATGAQGGEVRVYRTLTHALVHALKAGSPVLDLAFSPDGRSLAAATQRGGVSLYDVQSGGLRATLRDGGAVLDVAFAGGGRFVVAGASDRTLRVWDAETGTQLHTIGGPSAVVDLTVSPDGSLVAEVQQGNPVVRVYDVAGGAVVASVQQPGEATGAAFSPNGAYLVTTGRRNGFVWDAHRWVQLHVLVGHDAAITDVTFAPDGRVVTASVDSSARVWDPATGDALFTLASQHQQKLLAVAVSPDSRQIVTASADETARVWSSPLGSPPFLLAGHAESVTATSFSPDGRLLLTASRDGTARLWDPSAPTLTALGTQDGAISTVSYSPNGREVVSGGDDGTARLWGASGRLLQTLRQGGRVTRAFFVAGGADVVTAGEDGTAKLWRATDGSLLATFAHGAPVHAAAAVPGGGVVTGGDDGVVKLWAPDGKLVWSVTQRSPVAVAAVSKDGVVATGAADGSVRLWRRRDGAPLHTLSGHKDAVTSLAFSPDGTLLASGSADDDARIWTVRSGALVHRLVGHAFGVTSVAFSPDGRLLLSAGVDGDARLWSVRTGLTIHRLHFHVATVSQAAFSPDGRWIATAGPAAAGIWQTRTGDLLYAVGGTSGNLTSIAWAPDGRRIVAGGTGGGVSTFRCAVCVGVPALRAQAKARLAALH
jgi:WD40 repeat protein